MSPYRESQDVHAVVVNNGAALKCWETRSPLVSGQSSSRWSATNRSHQRSGTIDASVIAICSVYRTEPKGPAFWVTSTVSRWRKMRPPLKDTQ
jgi:hypothetical protein